MAKHLSLILTFLHQSHSKTHRIPCRQQSENRFGHNPYKRNKSSKIERSICCAVVTFKCLKIKVTFSCKLSGFGFIVTATIGLLSRLQMIWICRNDECNLPSSCFCWRLKNVINSSLPDIFGYTVDHVQQTKLRQYTTNLHKKRRNPTNV